jgi:flagellar assembly factor FliW
VSFPNAVRATSAMPGQDDARMHTAVVIGEGGNEAATDPSVITFTQPIPGFPGLKRFVLVRLEGDSAISELRSLEREDVRFVVATPAAFFSDYAIEIDDQQCSDLGLTDAEDVLILVVLTVGRDAASTTANLLAPVVVNVRTRSAAQLILTGSDWPVRAPLG